MTVMLETLELTPEELEASKEAVRKLAYCHWLDAGCPSGDGADFWLLAEREWIERCYVPDRQLAGERPQADVAASVPAAGKCCQTEGCKQERRHKKVAAR